MALQTRLITADEFWEIVLHDDSFQDRRVELIDGEIIDMPPSSFINTVIAIRIARRLDEFVEKHGLGWVSGADGGYTLSANQVRVPDVAYISKERQPTLTERVNLPPDLAVEVISKSERTAQIFSKIGLYLRSGVRMVWAVFPDDQEVLVCRPSDDGMFITETFDINGTLNGSDVLPGFTLPVRDIFPPQAAQSEPAQTPE